MVFAFAHRHVGCLNPQMCRRISAAGSACLSGRIWRGLQLVSPSRTRSAVKPYASKPCADLPRVQPGVRLPKDPVHVFRGEMPSVGTRFGFTGWHATASNPASFPVWLWQSNPPDGERYPPPFAQYCRKRRTIAEPRSVTLSTGSGAAAQTMAMPPPQSTLPMPHGSIRAGAQAMCPYPCQERSVRPAAALDAARRSNPDCRAYSLRLRSREQRQQPCPRPLGMRLIRSVHTTAALGTLLLASD